MRDHATPTTRRWCIAFGVVFAAELLLKLLVALHLAPFVDEAFYWQESRHLAFGYSDLPPLTALMIRAGETMAGHGLFGMRWPFLLVASALPWLMVALGRRCFGPRVGWQAGLGSLMLPLAATLGVVALPDVALTSASALALYALVGAMDTNRWRDWTLLGVALALAWVTHYRAGMLILAGLLVMLVTPRGRMQWRRPRFWWAMGIAVLGLIPIVVSNWQDSGAGLSFQLFQRNPWSFHAGALVQPLEQALAVTPLLYGVLLWVLWRSLRRVRSGAPWDVLAVTAATFLVGYFLLGLFADASHFRAHWPLPGYLPLLVALPVVLGEGRQHPRWRRGVLTATVVIAVAGQVTIYGYLGATAVGGRALDPLQGMKAFPVNFTGWRASAAKTRQLLDTMPRDTVLVADNFMLAAELDFALDGQRPVYTLDSPLNAKHGRAVQEAVWQRDEAGLRATHAGDPALLVVDEWILRAQQRPGWLGSICSRVAKPQFLTRLDLYGDMRRFGFYAARIPQERGPSRDRDDCVVWRKAFARQKTLLQQGRR